MSPGQPGLDDTINNRAGGAEQFEERKEGEVNIYLKIYVVVSCFTLDRCALYTWLYSKLSDTDSEWLRVIFGVDCLIIFDSSVANLRLILL